MNPISELRKEIKLALRLIDQDYTEHKEPFSNENIGSLKVNDIYFLDIASSNIQFETSSNSREFNIPSSLEVVAKGGVNAIDNRDNLVCNIMEFILYITSKKTIASSFFNDVSVIDINIERYGDNNQWSKVVVSMEHKVNYNQD